MNMNFKKIKVLSGLCDMRKESEIVQLQLVKFGCSCCGVV